MKTSAGQLKKGNFVEHSNDIYQIVKVDHSHVGRGSATIKFKVKSVSAGNTLELSFKPDNTVEQVDVNTVMMQYLYNDGTTMTLMNDQTYEQVEVPVATAEHFINYLSEGQKMYVAMHDGNALSVIPPAKVRLKVTEAHDAAKGNTAQGAKKQVTVETGATVMVPLFIKKGEMIAVNPETGEYLERASE